MLLRLQQTTEASSMCDDGIAHELSRRQETYKKPKENEKGMKDNKMCKSILQLSNILIYLEEGKTKTKHKKQNHHNVAYSKV